MNAQQTADWFVQNDAGSLLSQNVDPSIPFSPNVSETEKRKVREVVERYIRAFEEGDFQTPFHILTPTLQRRFSNNVNTFKKFVLKNPTSTMERKKIQNFVILKDTKTNFLWISMKCETKNFRSSAFYILKPTNKTYEISKEALVETRLEPTPTPAPYDPFRVQH